MNELNLEELDDIELDSETAYEVWAIGYDVNNTPIECDYLLDTFGDPDAAITFADSVGASEIREVTGEPLLVADHFSIEVETTLVIGGEPMNVGTIYRRIIYYNSMAADVAITAADYEMLEDGTIKIKKSLLEKFIGQDTIKILFADEREQPVLTFKIVTEPDATYYICDIIF
jgi:hypothetical protein